MSAQRSTEFARLEQTMQKVAIEAGRFLMDFRPKVTRLESDTDFLINADKEVNRLIRNGLFAAFPTVPYTSEEEQINDFNQDNRFAIDPIDASKNYEMGDSNFVTSLAYIEGRQAKVGVMYFPERDELYSAIEGVSSIRQLPDGFSRRGTVDLQVNSVSKLEDAQIWTEWCKETKGRTVHPRVRELLRRVGERSLYPQIRNCAAGDAIAVARGIATGFVMLKPDPFDCAAAGLIVRQAGGKVTDLEGNEWGPMSESIVATNGKIHKELIQLIRDV